MPAPVGVVSGGPALAGTSEQVPVPFQTLRMYALPVALKSAGVVLLSSGTAKAKYALGPPTKLGMSSFVPLGAGKITAAPSWRIRKTICGRVTAPSIQVDALFTSYVMTLARGGRAPAAATHAAFVFEVPAGLL